MSLAAGQRWQNDEGEKVGFRRFSLILCSTSWRHRALPYSKLQLQIWFGYESGFEIEGAAKASGKPIHLLPTGNYV